MIAANKKLISAEHVFVDSTHVKASANKRKFEKKIVQKKHERIKDVFKKKSIKIVKTMEKSLFHQINLIKKRPKRLKKVQRILRVATM